jgi:tRNA1Val (adenine37-N6)-methyltransferase
MSTARFTCRFFMPKKIFYFKQFSVAHHLCAQKVGTDAVLVGAWTDIPLKAKNILDVGTGSGLIALMMAQRSKAIVDAIDIDNGAFQQATINFNNVEWCERLHAFHTSFQNFNAETKYDVIISNPPFFENSLKPLQQERSKARHNDHLTFTDLIVNAKRLLKNEGTISVIIPFEQKNNFVGIANRNNFHLKRITSVKGTQEAKFKRVLIESIFEPDIIPDLKQDELVIEQSRNQYTEEYKTLTKDFYLKF